MTLARYWMSHPNNIEETNRAGFKRKQIETVLGIFLKKYVPGLRPSERGGIGPIYEFPPLADCRAAFERLIQQEIDWPEQKDWRDKNAFSPPFAWGVTEPTIPPSKT